MNNKYLNFIANKFNFLTTVESMLLALLLLLFSFLLISLFLNIFLKKNSAFIVKKLLKQEKILLNIKNSYVNGEINAIEYKKRIINLTKNKI